MCLKINVFHFFDYNMMFVELSLLVSFATGIVGVAEFLITVENELINNREKYFYLIHRVVISGFLND